MLFILFVSSREFFVQNLEVRFNKALVGMMMYNPDTMDIAKPSELLNSVKVIMSVLQSIENYGKGWGGLIRKWLKQ